jgi:hypothetical protein
VVSNPQGSATSEEAVLTVTSNRPPTAAITSPAATDLYRGGQTIRFAGTGSDGEDGPLDGGAFTWKVDFHHESHTHPILAPASGSTSGSFTMPVEGETSDNVWIRIHLTVVDGEGLSHHVQRDIHPRKAVVTLATSPPGLRIRLDGTGFPAPHVFTGVAGIRRNLEAESPLTLGGRTYEFTGWSDGGGANHGITTPDTATTYTATYRETAGAGPVLYEAEDGSMGGAEAKVVYPGYTGNGYVKYQNYRSWVAWQVESEAGGTATLEFRYAIGTPGTRTVRIIVNGTTLDHPLFPTTGSWSDWGTVSLPAEVEPGGDRIPALISGDGGRCMDHRSVR